MQEVQQEKQDDLNRIESLEQDLQREKKAITAIQEDHEVVIGEFQARTDILNRKIKEMNTELKLKEEEIKNYEQVIEEYTADDDSNKNAQV